MTHWSYYIEIEEKTNKFLLPTEMLILLYNGIIYIMYTYDIQANV